MTIDPRRSIPAVDRLLANEAFAPLLERAPRAWVRAVLEGVQREVRARIATGEDAVPTEPSWYAERVRLALAERERPSLRHVINATGVVLHTNLGRAPLAEAALEAVRRVGEAYTNLEYDVEAGRRGSRYDHCVGLLRELTGAESALVVNNNAAAVALALNTLAAGKEAVVSRGELVEIGGSFRIPEVVAASGARLREVGATNKTHLRDYLAALGEATGAILKVHRSNFRVVGFTAEVPLAELVELGREHGIPVVEDLGSGLLHDLSEFGLPPEPTAGDSIRAGATVVTMSGDKLLGGPQAGIILGAEEWIARMRANPLCRAFRVDKLTLAALEATLQLYRDPERARREVPTLRMLAAHADELRQRATTLCERLNGSGVAAAPRDGFSAVGGGAYPEAELPTTLVAVDLGRPAHEAERALRAGEPPVIARIADSTLVLDPRTILPGEEEALVQALRRVNRAEGANRTESAARCETPDRAENANRAESVSAGRGGMA